MLPMPFAADLPSGKTYVTLIDDPHVVQAAAQADATADVQTIAPSKPGPVAAAAEGGSFLGGMTGEGKE